MSGKRCLKCGKIEIKSGVCYEPCRDPEDFYRSENTRLSKEIRRLRAIEEKARAWLEADRKLIASVADQLGPDLYQACLDGYATTRERLREALEVKA